MNYGKAYKEALERAKNLHKDAIDMGENIRAKQCEIIFPELKESEDEKIRKWLIDWAKVVNWSEQFTVTKEQVLAWLEKQGHEPNWRHHKADLSAYSEEYRKAYYDGWNNCNMQHSQYKAEMNDVVKCLINGMKFFYEDNKDATWGTDKWSMPVKHIIDVLEKQVPIDENKLAKGVLSSCALSFIDYLDTHKYEGKMCVSNGECEDIENAFHNAMWDRLHRYYCKYIEKQGEQKSSDEVLKIRQEVYQSGYNDGYKHGIEDVKQGEKKPIEWKDSDEKYLFWALLSIQKDIAASEINGVNTKDLNDCVKWLYSLKQRIKGE